MIKGGDLLGTESDDCFSFVFILKIDNLHIISTLGVRRSNYEIIKCAKGGQDC